MNEDQKQGVETHQKKSWVNLHPVATVVIIVVGFLILIGIFTSGSQNNSTTPTSATQVAGQPSGLCDNFDKTTTTSSISYAELDKDPVAYNGTNVVYVGQVVQIQQNPDGSGIIRLAITKTDYGYSLSDIVYVTYSGGTNAVDDDIVKVYGQMTGAETYTSEANYQITIPSMVACEIDDQTQAQPAAQKPSAPVAAPVQIPITVTPSAPQASTSTPESWHTVTTVTTATSENTPPFTIRGTEWRATWSCQIATSPDDVAPAVFAQKTNGLGGDSVAQPNNCPSGNTTYFYDGPGTYYLKVMSFGSDTMTVTIEDYY